MEPHSNIIHNIHSLRSNLMPLLSFSTLLGFVLIIQQKFSNVISHSILFSSASFLIIIPLFIVLFLIKPYLTSTSSSSRPIYLVDFSCYKPPSFCRVPFSSFLENASKIGSFDSESVAFMAKILASSGQSEETYLPPALHYIPPKTQHRESVKEVNLVLFAIMDDLLAKTNLSPQNIDVLIVNCSGFCPSPSLSSIVVNRYAMRSDVKSFNLSGMGCSASALAVDLAQSLLRIYDNSNAVVLSTEILSQGWYRGREKPMLLLNCLFRMGSAAILLTNRREAKRVSKYELVKTLRTQRSFDDGAYLSAMREEDSDGNLGVTLRRDLIQVAGETLRSNITLLGSSILPLREKLRYGVSSLGKRLAFMDSAYVPDFKTVIKHFCLPASGAPVIREIGKGLGLGERDTEAALMTLRRFGNQSSSSLWYELAYMEAKERVEAGDWVWQIGMGSGPKCSSVVWKCLRPILGEAQKGPWAECIDMYPIVSTR